MALPKTCAERFRLLTEQPNPPLLEDREAERDDG